MKGTRLKTTILILFIFKIILINAQSGMVSGVLTDDVGDVLPGVSIIIKGTTIGTMTNVDGYYNIECNVGETLIFSYIGMDTREVIVTEEMFSVSTENSVKRPKVIIKNPVAPIKSQDYLKKLNKETLQLKKYTDMSSAYYKWTYGKNNNNISYFNTYNFQQISEKKDSLFVFDKSPEPLLYSVEYNSVYSVRSILNFAKLQSDYGQGRPFAGENTWFGSETSEVFAWGPKIENLAFDGSSYLFDNNGRLVPKSPTYTMPANSYNPYDIFNKGDFLRNSIKIKLKKNNTTLDFILTDNRENGFYDPIKTQSDILKINIKQNFNVQEISGGLSYYRADNHFMNSNALRTKTMAAVMLTAPTFDNSQGYIFDDGTQRSSALGQKNNPYFLLNTNSNRIFGEIYQANVKHKIDIYDWTIKSSINFQKENNQEQSLIRYNTIGYTDSQSLKKNANSSELSIKINSNYNYDRFTFFAGAEIEHQYLKYDQRINDLLQNDKNLKKNTVRLVQTASYKPFYSNAILLNVYNNSYISDQKNRIFLPKASIAIDVFDLVRTGHIFYLNITGSYSNSVAEFPLYFQDRSYGTLLYNIDQLNSYSESNDLFYDKNLKLETRQAFDIGIDIKNVRFLSRFTFALSAVYNNVKSKNSIFPLISNNSYELGNAASIQMQNWEGQASLNTNFYKFKWNVEFIFSKSNSEVLELYGNRESVPIAGFKSVSKNLIVGQPVGVIVGSVYEKNSAGQLIIGADGFPLVSDQTQIIGDPNPDYYMALENSFKLFNFSLNILIDHQKGGDIWNGTGNILDYHGLSERTAEERNITDYIFEGVDESGNVNTVPVDFADPENGLSGNKWYRYGYAGVAEDAIEEATWFRIKEISISYNTKLNRIKYIKDLGISIYAGNVLVLTNYSGTSPISYFNNYVQGQGLDLFNMPDLKEIGFRFKIRI